MTVWATRCIDTGPPNHSPLEGESRKGVRAFSRWGAGRVKELEYGKVDPQVLADVVQRVVDVASPDKVILFGSAARDEMGPSSDLDLLVVKDVQNAHDLTADIYGNLWGVEAAVDVIVVTPEQVERYKNSHALVIKPALQEGRVVYEAALEPSEGRHPAFPSAPCGATEGRTPSLRRVCRGASDGLSGGRASRPPSRRPRRVPTAQPPSAQPAHCLRPAGNTPSRTQGRQSAFAPRLRPDDPREWLNRARSNLALAANRIPGVYLEDLCFSAQQAAEKALKALLLQRSIDYPYVHDLACLLTLLEDASEPVPSSVAEAGKLTPYAAATTHPLENVVTEREYQEGLAIARAVVRWVESRI